MIIDSETEMPISYDIKNVKDQDNVSVRDYFSI